MIVAAVQPKRDLAALLSRIENKRVRRRLLELVRTLASAELDDAADDGAA